MGWEQAGLILFFMGMNSAGNKHLPDFVPVSTMIIGAILFLW